MTASAQTALSGHRKAAILLVLLGDEAAMRICDHLPQEELRILAEELSELGSIPAEMAAGVLEEYQRLSVVQDSVAQGGPDYAMKLLGKASGDEATRTAVGRVIRSQEMTARNFEALQRVGPQQIAKLLEKEHPQTIALVLAHLNCSVARGVLLLLPDTVRAQAVNRLADMQNCPPDVVKTISEVLHRKLLSCGEQIRRSYGGVKTVADMLNRIDPTVTTDILAGIEKDNAHLAASIRNQMFTFEDFVEVPEIGLRELLGQVDKKTLASALKGASENLRNHFFKSMSSRAVEMLKEDMEALGPIRSKDVSQAQTDIVAIARKLEAEGKMTLKNEAEEAYVV